MALIPVLLSSPFDAPFTYRADEALPAGTIVDVPLGKRSAIGVVWEGTAEALDEKRIKPIHKIISAPPLSPKLCEFVEWVARYTLSPRGLVLALILRRNEILHEHREQVSLLLQHTPEKLTAARQRVIDLLSEGVARTRSDVMKEAAVTAGALKTLVEQGAIKEIITEEKFDVPNPDYVVPKLNEAQKENAEQLCAAVRAQKFETFLLHGVTGSGKTEVHSEALAEALRQGGQALVLLPEIALTAQLFERFTQRFGFAPYQWHSKLSPARRSKLWRGIATGEVKLIIGARSALFFAVQNLRVVVVDEEHEGAYRQEDHVLYHARDMAVVRGKLEQCPVVLASATPSLESFVNAKAKRYTYLQLPERFGLHQLPEITTVDLRQEKLKSGQWLSQKLRAAIEQNLERGEQSLLYLNRRGYAPLTLCRACGHRFECKHCSAYMVEHRDKKRLQCHQCGASAKMPEACPSCGEKEKLAGIGLGVEKLAEEAQAFFPTARIMVLSSDHVGSFKKLEQEIGRIEKGEVDLIIGTQLVAKGHNFPGLTFVGVVDADFLLGTGDPRAGERTFQVLQQVTGRAGRGEKAGRAILQTYSPQHPVLEALQQGKAEAFYEAEADLREKAQLPPFGRLASIIVSAKDKAQAFSYIKSLYSFIISEKSVQVYGPSEAPFFRLQGKYRYRLLVKAGRGTDLQIILRQLQAGALKPPSGLRMVVDIDPYNFV